MDSVDGRRKFVEDTRQRKLDQRNGIESPAEPTAAAIDSSFFQAAFTQFLQQMVGNVTQPLPTQLNRSVHTASQHIAGLPNWDQSQELTVGELIDQYKEEKLGIDPFTDDDILGSEAEYAGKKYNEARLAYIRFWKLEFGHMLVGDLSPDHINSAINVQSSIKLQFCIISS